jgi:hypothetical protein
MIWEISIRAKCEEVCKSKVDRTLDNAPLIQLVFPLDFEKILPYREHNLVLNLYVDDVQLAMLCLDTTLEHKASSVVPIAIRESRHDSRLLVDLNRNDVEMYLKTIKRLN